MDERDGHSSFSYAIVNYYHTSIEGAGKVVSEIVANGGAVVAVQADVSDERQIDELFANTQESCGEVDILVNSVDLVSYVASSARHSSSY